MDMRGSKYDRGDLRPGGGGKGLDGLLAIEKGRGEEMGLAAIAGRWTGLRRPGVVHFTRVKPAKLYKAVRGDHSATHA
jgi:hypothetical protein